MRIEIDTEEKLIRLDDDVNIGELFDFFNAFFPNNSWRNYDLDIHVVNNIIDPIIIKQKDLTLPYVPEYPVPEFQDIVIEYGKYTGQDVDDDIKVFSLNIT